MKNMNIREHLIRYAKWFDRATMPDDAQTDEADLVQNVDSYLRMTENINLFETIVLRSASEVLLRLEEAEKELAYHQEWYKKAVESYDKNRRFFGQADDGEVMAASEAVAESRKEVIVLKWVLGRT
jgi:hypothetical protein